MPQIIDLTHTIHHEMTVYPGSAKPLIIQTNQVEKHGFAQSELRLLSHHGTHMDAPSHMKAGGKTLDQMNPEQFYGKGLCIDCRQASNESIVKEMLIPYSQQLETADFLLLYTAWSDYWGTEGYLSGFPVLDYKACEWLCHFKLKGIGLDNFSLDRMDSVDFANHLLVFNKNMVIIENLTGLKFLLDKDFSFSCFPLKYLHADGSPVRAVALVEE